MSVSRTTIVRNRRGLHARAAAKLAGCAAGFAARAHVVKDGEKAPADSIMDLLMLGAGPGSVVTIEAEGADAEAAVEALGALVECGFEEDD